MPLESTRAKPGPSDLPQEGGLSVEKLLEGRQCPVHWRCLRDPLPNMLFSISSILGATPYLFYILLYLFDTFLDSVPVAWDQRTSDVLESSICFTKDKAQ